MQCKGSSVVVIVMVGALVLGLLMDALKRAQARRLDDERFKQTT